MTSEDHIFFQKMKILCRFQKRKKDMRKVYGYLDKLI